MLRNALTRRAQSSPSVTRDPLPRFFGREVWEDFFRPLSLFGEPWTGEYAGQVWGPPADLYQTEEAWMIEVDLPGLSKNDIHINLEQNLLTLSGERPFEDTGYERRERWYGKFQRTFALPSAVDAEGVKASFSSGVLTITIPKAPEARSRHITIH